MLYKNYFDDTHRAQGYIINIFLQDNVHCLNKRVFCVDASTKKCKKCGGKGKCNVQFTDNSLSTDKELITDWISKTYRDDLHNCVQLSYHIPGLEFLNDSEHNLGKDMCSVRQKTQEDIVNVVLETKKLRETYKKWGHGDLQNEFFLDAYKEYTKSDYFRGIGGNANNDVDTMAKRKNQCSEFESTMTGRKNGYGKKRVIRVPLKRGHKITAEKARELKMKLN